MAQIFSLRKHKLQLFHYKASKKISGPKKQWKMVEIIFKDMIYSANLVFVVGVFKSRP